MYALHFLRHVHNTLWAKAGRLYHGYSCTENYAVSNLNLLNESTLILYPQNKACKILDQPLIKPLFKAVISAETFEVKNNFLVVRCLTSATF